MSPVDKHQQFDVPVTAGCLTCFAADHISYPRRGDGPCRPVVRMIGVCIELGRGRRGRAAVGECRAGGWFASGQDLDVVIAPPKKGDFLAAGSGSPGRAAWFR